ncbi:MAG: glycosyltransferase family 4 protein [Emcibacter sp.]|nr:glycosyltransferase family 4 protein [Emcibacter sp.]
MRVLTFTSLYPNKIDPRHGIFVKNRMTYFDQIENISRKVIAPVQYFPLLGLFPGSKFHRYSQVPKVETQENVAVYHPRYMTIPGTSLIDAAGAMTSAAEKILPKIYTDPETFDLVDGHYLYPDGVAAYNLAQKYDKPLILTARGSDVNFWMTQPAQKEEILRALNYASKIICVSAALKSRLIGHGIPEDKITVIMNGVDRSIFNADQRPVTTGEYLLSIGNLVPLKGHEYILHALAKLPDEKLVIIGSGPLEARLKNLAQQLKVTDRVTFLPNIPHDELPNFYRKAKCTILMSSMEGMPNVILESLACGTPVIATNVGGIAEVVTKDNGLLIAERTAEALTDALKIALQHPWDHSRISSDMCHLDWHETARKLHLCFVQAL